MLWMRLMLRWVSLETHFLKIMSDFKRLMHLSLIDFKNVSIVGHYVKDRTKDAQFIIIRYYYQLRCNNIFFAYTSHHL